MSSTVVRSSLCLAVVIALLLPAPYAVAGKGGIPLIVIIDNAGGLGGDDKEVKDGWSIYIDGAPGPITALRVQLISNSKTLALDTRGAGRTLRVDFGKLDYLTKGNLEALGLKFFEGTCVEIPGSDPKSYEECVVVTEALLEVLLSKPFTSLTGQTQGIGIAKLWFTMNGSDWRVDWPNVTVTSMAPDGGPRVWEVMAPSNGCLSNLSGKRTKPGTIGTEGCYEISILLGATEK